MTNQLYYGDNLDVLRSQIPGASVDLVYLDPPFNSNQDYSVIFKNTKGKGSEAQIKAFKDTWHWGPASEHALLRDIPEHCSAKVIETTNAIVDIIGKNDLSAYLMMMIPRLAELRRVLKPTGSLYLHCDSTASHYLKIMLDAIFGPEYYKSEIIWKRTSAHNDAKRYGRNIDIILYYTKGIDWTWNESFTPHESEYLSRFRFRDPDGRQWTDADLSAKGLTGGGYEYEYKGIKSLWRCPEETMRRLDAEGRLHFTKAGGIRLKRYLDENKGAPLQSLWEDISPINSQAKERLGYPTQKPLVLLERIINTSSNPGDTVLDPFCGCGTTIHAAQRLGRNWIGIDITSLATSLIEYRLTAAFPGIKFTTVGLPRDVDGAKYLADEDKHQFEWWALSLVKAKPAGEGATAGRGKKGADGGKDGIIFFRDTGDKLAKVIVSVKGGKNVGVEMVRSLGDVVEEQKAAIGVFITLEPPTKPMTDWATQKGLFHSDSWGDFPKIQIMTIEQLLNGEKIKMPPTTVAETFSSPSKESKKPDAQQGILL